MTNEASLETKEKRFGLPRWVKLVLFAVLGIVLIIAIRELNLKEYLTQALAYIESVGVWGPIIFIGIYILATVLFIPGSILTLGAGTAFGVVMGSVYVSIASTIGASCAFLIGRYFLRDWVSETAGKNEKFAAIDGAVENEGWKIVGLTRLSPAFPFSLLNYAYGITGVKFWHYVLASWIGMMPGTVLYVYIGSLGNAVAQDGGRTPAQWAMLIVGLLATLGVTIFITRIARKALARKVGDEADATV
jgi:uncharacterized membrane protein YdjX (TVP38/TMEM64 family)